MHFPSAAMVSTTIFSSWSPFFSGWVFMANAFVGLFPKITERRGVLAVISNSYLSICFMKKLLLPLLLMAVLPLYASHIVGGEFELLHLNGYNYQLNMILYL